MRLLFMQTTIISVSYTHLDVYKRQVYWVRTFKTIEDLKAFVENENTDN